MSGEAFKVGATLVAIIAFAALPEDKNKRLSRSIRGVRHISDMLAPFTGAKRSKGSKGSPLSVVRKVRRAVGGLSVGAA